MLNIMKCVIRISVNIYTQILMCVYAPSSVEKQWRMWDWGCNFQTRIRVTDLQHRMPVLFGCTISSVQSAMSINVLVLKFCIELSSKIPDFFFQIVWVNFLLLFLLKFWTFIQCFHEFYFFFFFAFFFDAIVLKAWQYFLYWHGINKLNAVIAT